MQQTLNTSRKHSRDYEDLVDSRNSKLSSPLELQPPRYYQSEANEAICNTLQENSKCLVKMFCGTGKSLVMATCDIHQESNLSLFVFPSLALIEQFYRDYLLRVANSPEHILRVSSDGGDSTTDPAEIAGFLTNTSMIGLRSVCVTYQSYDTLVQVMDQCGVVADNAMYDEGHRAVGKSYQTHIFHLGADPHVRKQVFFTATPKNDNGIVMYEETNPERSMCGPLAFNYSYFRGMIEGYLNPFEIRIDFSTEQGNTNIYKSIARAILTTGNNRVLTFHTYVETDRDSSARNFSNREAFVAAFEEVCCREFPNKVGFYSTQRIRLVVLAGTAEREERSAILESLDTTPDNEIYIISSCRTIGEGIDTKKANMCVFVDPKTSHVDIIQNIGRIIRKIPGKGCSTVLIPCWVDRAKYEAVQDNPEARDEVIRQDVQETGGNFNAILNVVSALKQEDLDLYDACLHYPNCFSHREIENNLQGQGYELMESVDEEGRLIPTLNYLLEKDIDPERYKDFDEDEERIQHIAKDHDVCVEIHNDSLDQPVKKFNVGCESGEVVRLFRNQLTDDDCDEYATYQPIVKKSTTPSSASQSTKKSSRDDPDFIPPDKKKRVVKVVHNNPDVMVLWKVCGDGLLDGISQAIEPEVVDKVQKLQDDLVAMETFKEETGRLPRTGGSSRTPKESELGNKLGHLKTNYKTKTKNMLDPACREIFKRFCERMGIEEPVPLDERRQRRLRSRLSRITDFHKQNGWMPRICKTRKKPFFPGEEELGHFLANIKENYKKQSREMADPACRELFKQFCEDNGIEEPVSLGEKMQGRLRSFLAQVKSYFEKNEEMPRTEASENKPFLPGEKKIGRPWSTLKANYRDRKQNMADLENREILEQFCDTLGIELDPEKQLRTTLARINVYYEKYQEMPRESGLDRTQEEKTNGQLWGDIKRKYKDETGCMSDPACREILKRFCEGLGIDLPVSLNERMGNKLLQDLEKIKSYNERYTRMPRESGLDRTTEEKIHGQLWGELKKKYKNETGCMADPGNRAAFRQVCQNLGIEVPVSLNERMKTQLHDVLAQIKNHRTQHRELPRTAKSKNKPFLPGEKELGTSLANLKTNYKDQKKNMADPENRAIFKKFCEDNDIEEPVKRNPVFSNEKDVADLPPVSKPVGGGGGEVGPRIGTIHHPDTTPTPKPPKKKSPKKKSMELAPPTMSPSPPPSKELTEEERQEREQQRRERNKSQLSEYHQKFKTMRSDSLHAHFQENNNKAFIEYHNCADANEETYDDPTEIPRNRIIAALEQNEHTKTAEVLDLGCGRYPKIRDHFAGNNKYNVRSFDHVAISEGVEECDISHLPVPSNSVDYVVMSLAMWGSNKRQYLQEAHRVLNANGCLYIGEPTKKWGFTKEAMDAARLKDLLQKCGFTIVDESIKKFSVFTCVKIRKSQTCNL